MARGIDPRRKKFFEALDNYEDALNICFSKIRHKKYDICEYSDNIQLDANDTSILIRCTREIIKKETAELLKQAKKCIDIINEIT